MSVSAGSLPSFERKAPAACRPALQHPHSSAFADGLQHAGVLQPSVTGQPGQPGQLEIELSGNFSQITALIGQSDSWDPSAQERGGEVSSSEAHLIRIAAQLPSAGSCQYQGT